MSKKKNVILMFYFRATLVAEEVQIMRRKTAITSGYMHVKGDR